VGRQGRVDSRLMMTRSGTPPAPRRRAGSRICIQRSLGAAALLSVGPTDAAPCAAPPSNEVDMPTYPPSRHRRRQRAAWPRIIILVIILVFVIVMTALGYAPEAAAGVAAAALAAASSATGEPRDEPGGEIPGAHA
jgi:hypothetical protein